MFIPSLIKIALFSFCLSLMSMAFIILMWNKKYVLQEDACETA